MENKSAMDLVREAQQQIETLSNDQVNEELSKGDVSLIDLREGEEITQHGRMAGSVQVPRGMLEFFADPSLPLYKSEFDKTRRIILYCAAGNPSALATITLKQMGYENIAHMAGGFTAWKNSGKPTIS